MVKPTEINWIYVVNAFAKLTGNNFVYSWHLREHLGIPTATINYHLNKLVTKGLLTKETCVYYTKYTLTPIT